MRCYQNIRGNYRTGLDWDYQKNRYLLSEKANDDCLWKIIFICYILKKYELKATSVLNNRLYEGELTCQKR